MNKRGRTVFLAIMLILTLSISLIPIGHNASTYAETTTPADAFLVPVTPLTQVPDGFVGIYTKSDLDDIRNNLSGNYILMNDIAFSQSDFESTGEYYNSGAGWAPIGDYVDAEFPEVGEAFSGILNGNGYTVSGLYINIDGQTSTENIYAGLFASITGDVKNLGLVDLDIAATAASTAFVYAGGVTADIESGATIDNCYTTGQISAKSAAGGIVGTGEDCNVRFSKNLCAVTAGTAGGIFGGSGGTVAYCMNSGSVTGLNYAGGIEGALYDDEFGVVYQCYNTGNVTAPNYSGGIVAVNWGSIRDCFNTGKIEATGLSGIAAGIVAKHNGFYDIENCYNTGQISTASGIVSNSAGISTGVDQLTDCYYLKGCGGTGFGVALTDTQMKSQTSFSGFDFAKTWSMDSRILRPVLIGIIPDIHNIEYNLGGGSLPSNTPMAYMSGSNNLLATPMKTAYIFKGWYDNSGFLGNPITLIPADATTDVSYYAKWGAPILSAASYNYTSIRIAWTPVGGATSYRIYRAPSATGPYSLVYKASATTKAWINTGLTTGKTYYYKVFPVVDGKIYSFKTYKYAKAVPAAPKINLTEMSSTSIKISWYGVSGATKYQIFRAISSTGTYSLIHTSRATTRSWIDTGLTSGKTYYYKVRAYHLEGTTKVYGICSVVQYLK